MGDNDDHNDDETTGHFVTPSPLGPLGKFRYSIQYLWNRVGLSPLHRCVTTLLYKPACKFWFEVKSIQSIRVFILVGVLAPNRATFCQPWNQHIPDTAEIRFSVVRSPRFWVSGYWTKWRIQGSFDSSYSRSFNVKTWPRNSIFSLNNFRYVR